MKGKPVAYLVTKDDFDGVWYHTKFVKVFFDKRQAEHYVQHDKRSLDIEEVEVGY
jgi:hypothetical protein